MSSSDPRLKTKRWKRLRLYVLDRDGWRCTAVHPGCKYTQRGSLARRRRAAHVHHIWAPSEGGPFWDPDNLQAVCSSFNIAERNYRYYGKTKPTAVPPSRDW